MRNHSFIHFHTRLTLGKVWEEQTQGIVKACLRHASNSSAVFTPRRTKQGRWCNKNHKRKDSPLGLQTTCLFGMEFRLLRCCTVTWVTRFLMSAI